MSNETIFRRGWQFWALPFHKEVWQFALFVIGHDRWQQYEDDHDTYEQITWYVQFLMWQVSYTREANYDHC